MIRIKKNLMLISLVITLKIISCQGSPITTHATTTKVTGTTGTTVTGVSTTHVTTTISPAEQLLIDLGADSINFKKLQDTINGVPAAPAAPAAAPAAPKKQLSINQPNAQMSQQEIERAAAEKKIQEIADNMAEIEKLNLMNSPSVPKAKPATNSGPAAQSKALPSPSSSSSDDSSSNNAKVIGSAVGGSLAGVALIVGAVFAIVHSKKKRNDKISEETVKNDIADESNYGGIDEDLE